MKDKIKELIKSGEHEDLIVEALNIATKFYGSQSDDLCNDMFSLGERIKKALTKNKKPVDMLMFVGSPIDCCFGDTEKCFETEGTIAKLGEIVDGYYRCALKGYGDFHMCKPRMNYWLSIDLFANDRLCGLFIEKLENAGFELDCNYFDGYLRSFKVTGLRDGFCWPWECE